MAQPQEFPFNIMDVAELLHLHIRRRQADSVYADCPICGDKRGKMNINFAKNLWRCNYCNEGGGMLSLYGKVYGISNSEAYREICDTLQNGLTAPEYTAKVLPEQAAIEQSVLASPQEIHQTFSMLLELLTLTPQHRKHLREVRGLTDEQIERLGYKSTPPFYLCRSLAQKLRSRGCKVEGVPGFYVGKDDKWTVNFNSVTAGIIIPAKGIDGMICGAQIRLDTPIREQESDPDKSGTKYLWLSSASKKRGVSSGSPVHFVGDPFARVVYVTEGLLKADVAHFLMDRSFAATAGANNVNKLDMLFALLAANGTEVIIEAEDMDKYHNAAVSKGASKIYLMARSHGLECRRLTWDPNYKGIDDWQLAMRQKKEQRDVSQMNFRTRFVCGLCSFDAISEEIAAWHERNICSSTLHDHLGLSEQEYARFLRDGDAALEQYLLSLRAQQCFRIYQPDVSEGKAADFAFGGIRALQKAGYEQPPASEYALVYEGALVCEVQQDDAIRLKLVAARYSGELPADYHGRSVSPSTVIEFFDENGRRYFYCDGNDIYLPYLCYFRFRHRNLAGLLVNGRVCHRCRARLLRACEGIEGVLCFADQSLHILEGDGGIVLILGGTVHGDEAVGIVGRGTFVWIDDLLLVSAGSGKIRVNPGANILLPLLQQVADRLRDLIDVLHNGGVVVKNRCVWTSFNPCLGQPAEDHGWQQHDEQDGKHQQPGNDGSNRLAMCPECRCRRTVRTCGSSTFCRTAYRFSCLDGAAHGTASVCADLSGFVQTAAFLLGHIKSCPFCEAGQADAGSGSHDRKCRHPDSDKAFSPLRPVRTAYTTLHHPRW